MRSSLTAIVILAALLASGCFDQESWIEIYVSAADHLMDPRPQLLYCVRDLPDGGTLTPDDGTQGFRIVRARGDLCGMDTVPLPGTIVIRHTAGMATQLRFFAQLTASVATATDCLRCPERTPVGGSTCLLSEERLLTLPMIGGNVTRHRLRFDDMDTTTLNASGETRIEEIMVAAGVPYDSGFPPEECR